MQTTESKSVDDALRELIGEIVKAEKQGIAGPVLRSLADLSKSILRERGGAPFEDSNDPRNPAAIFNEYLHKAQALGFNPYSEQAPEDWALAEVERLREWIKSEPLNYIREAREMGYGEGWPEGREPRTAARWALDTIKSLMTKTAVNYYKHAPDFLERARKLGYNEPADDPKISAADWILERLETAREFGSEETGGRSPNVYIAVSPGYVDEAAALGWKNEMNQSAADWALSKLSALMKDKPKDDPTPKAPPYTESISNLTAAEIEAEQRRGRAENGKSPDDYANDDARNPVEWLMMIHRHISQAHLNCYLYFDPHTTVWESEKRNRFRSELVKIAALAKSAVEAMDRRF